MLVSLLRNERIHTTLAKGKELRRWADKIISLGKKGTLHARRRAFAVLRDREAVKRLFEEIVPQLKDREGGYTYIYKLGWRQGDGAPLSLVELVTFSPKAKEKESPVTKAKKVLEKVTPKRKAKVEKKEKPKEEKGKKIKKEEKETPKEKKEKPKKKPSTRPPKAS
jgi:large subunit ribosomal protein L17